MSSGTWNREIESPVAAARLFKAIVGDWHNLAPKLVPEFVASATAEEVEGGVGSTRQLNFTAGLFRRFFFFPVDNFMKLRINKF